MLLVKKAMPILEGQSQKGQELEILGGTDIASISKKAAANIGY